MLRIAIIQGSYVRDTQLYTGDPAAADWEDGFTDQKDPQIYVGLFDAASEAQVRQIAAEFAGVHPNSITLIAPTEPKRFRDRQGRLTVSIETLAELTSAEGRYYFVEGGKYLFQHRLYTLRLSAEGCPELICNDPQYHRIALRWATIGTFLPDVASVGLEIVRADDVRGCQI